MPRSNKVVADQAAMGGAELQKEVEKALLDFNVTMDVAEKQLMHLRQLREYVNMTLASHENRMHSIIQQAPQAMGMGASLPPATMGRR